MVVFPNAHTYANARARVLKHFNASPEFHMRIVLRIAYCNCDIAFTIWWVMYIVCGVSNATRVNKSGHCTQSFALKHTFRIMNYRDEHSQRNRRGRHRKVLTLHRNLQPFRSCEYNLDGRIYMNVVHARTAHAFMGNQMDNLYVNRFDLFWNGDVRMGV